MPHTEHPPSWLTITERPTEFSRFNIQIPSCSGPCRLIWSNWQTLTTWSRLWMTSLILGRFSSSILLLTQFWDVLSQLNEMPLTGRLFQITYLIWTQVDLNGKVLVLEVWILEDALEEFSWKKMVEKLVVVIQMRESKWWSKRASRRWSRWFRWS